jgi:hypothetical protein
MLVTHLKAQNRTLLCCRNYVRRKDFSLRCHILTSTGAYLSNGSRGFFRGTTEAERESYSSSPSSAETENVFSLTGLSPTPSGDVVVLRNK